VLVSIVVIVGLLGHDTAYSPICNLDEIARTTSALCCRP
jgi:hypothetical protein